MSNTKRPSIQRQHTRSSDKKRNEALDMGMAITLDGVEYAVRAGDLNALDSRELRRQVGLTFPQVLEAFSVAPDLDLVAAIIWLARRIKGETSLPYDEVAATFGFEDFDRIEVAETDAEEADDPEA